MAARKYSAEFKAKVAIEAIKGEETTSQIASRYGIHPAQVRQWKREVISKASAVFDKSQNREKQLERKIDILYRQVGQLTVEKDFLLRKSGLL